MRLARILDGPERSFLDPHFDPRRALGRSYRRPRRALLS
jgi:hypothetical protein